MSPCNPVTPPVTQMVSGVVTNPAPHHTTPHHTTKERDLGSSDQVRSGWHPRETNQLDAAAITLVALRPDWRHDATRDALATDPRPWRTVIAAALACALDPQAHPALIGTTRPQSFTAHAGPTPTPPTVAEYRATPRCHHGAAEGACALCRRHIPAEETPR